MGNYFVMPKLWKGDLDCLGYSLLGEYETKSETSTRLSKNLDVEATNVLLVLKKYMLDYESSGQFIRARGSKAVFFLWFLDGIEFDIPGKGDNKIKVCDWLYRWGNRYKDYFKRELDVVDIKFEPKVFDKPPSPNKMTASQWPTKLYQEKFSKTENNGRIIVMLYFDLDPVNL